MNGAREEIKRGERFAFGKNWSRFLTALNEDRIKEGEISLQDMLEIKDLSGKSFLDVGSGSGLFSLAAHRLGAKVHSFDFDPQSVACTFELKRRFFLKILIGRLSKAPFWILNISPHWGNGMSYIHGGFYITRAIYGWLWKIF